MNKFTFDLKQVKMNRLMKSILQLIISTSSATLEVPSLWGTRDNPVFLMLDQLF